jgi:hypothetical protein
MKINEAWKNGRKQAWVLAFALIAGVALCGASAEYFTGFEAPEFSAGPLPQGSWTIDGTGSAQIQTSVVYEGAQALEIAQASTVDRDLVGIVSGDVIWIDAFARVAPQDPLPNPTEVGTGSSLVHFSLSNGIACYDGLTSSWRTTGVTVDAGRWYRITIRQDYGVGTWDCYVDGERKLGNLGFKDNLASLSGFKASSSETQSSYLDNFWVGEEVPAFLFPGSKFATLFEFSTLWETTDQTAYNETLFRLYDITGDSSINAYDLYRLIFNLQEETAFN